jgi:hypothetical protein
LLPPLLLSVTALPRRRSGNCPRRVRRAARRDGWTASPALIEKTRSAVTDGTGQYRIIDLKPGTYALTFTLQGFATVKREAVELSGTQTATIPIEMRVGAIAESVTVTGESPVVDVQSAKREVVLNNQMIQALPLARAVGALLNATPGLTVDTNGPALSPTMTFFNAHSTAANSAGVAGEGRMTVNGMTVAAARSGGVSSYVYDTPNAEEVAIIVGGGLGESDIGGPVMNLVQQSGGNSLAGMELFNQAGNWSWRQSDRRPRAIGLTQTPGIVQAYDVSGSFGGPIWKDRLWFYGSYRNPTQTAVEGTTPTPTPATRRVDWVGSPISARLVGPSDDHRPSPGRWERAASPTIPNYIAARARRSPSRRAVSPRRRLDRPATMPRRSSRRKRRRHPRGYFDVPFYESAVLDDARQ